MNTTNTISAWHLEKITKDGVACLGIPMESTAKKYFFEKLFQFKKSKGWIVGTDTISEWVIEGIHSLNTDSYFYGQYFKGQLLEELLEQKPDEWKTLLLRLAQAYSRLSEKIATHIKFYTLSVYFLDDGGVLFLPPELMEEIITVSTPELKLKQQNIIKHPYLAGEDAVSYTLAVISYKSITGHYPFSAETEDDLRYMIRNRKLTPLYLSFPGFKREESRFIMAGLGQGETLFPGVKAWEERLKSWQTTDLFAEIPETEQRDLQDKARKKDKALERNFRLGVFFHKYKWVTLGITAACLTVIMIAGTGVYNAYFKPRTTKNLDPLQLVQAFYTSFNKIDYFTMEDCVTGSAAKGDVNEVMNLYVITKQQSVYELTEPTTNVETWTKAGRPELAPGAPPLYGISGLQIKQLAGDPEPVFQAEYEKWTSEYQEEANMTLAKRLYLGTRFKDLLTLKRDRGGWVIYKQERTNAGTLPYPSTEDAGAL